MNLSKQEQDYIFAFLQDKEFGLTNFKEMDAFISDLEEMYWEWFKWYLEQPYEDKKRYMSEEKL